MKNKLILFFSLILTLNLFASTDTKFYNINSMYGISMRKITSISKDDKGFIWGASKMGILRVTEGDCRIYQLPYIATDIISVNLTYSYSYRTIFPQNTVLTPLHLFWENKLSYINIGIKTFPWKETQWWVRFIFTIYQS